MEAAYQHLKKELKQQLNVFRVKYLVYHLMRGGIIILFSLLILLLFFQGIRLLSLWTVGLKTLFYVVFWGILILEGILFIARPFFIFFFSYSFKNDLLLNQILHFFPFQKDVLVSIYQLAFHSEIVSGDERLKKAAFVQKYHTLKAENLKLDLPTKIWGRQWIYLLVLFFFSFLNFSVLRGWYEDLKDYQTIYQPSNEIHFMLQNESLKVEYGKSLQLQLKVYSPDISVENVFICYGGGEFLMRREDSLYTYDFEVINNDIKLNFKVLDKVSEWYEIKVLPSPTIVSYQITSIPPRYTGLKPEILKNTVDFRVLYGSVLQFNLHLADVDSLYLTGDNKRFTTLSLPSSSFADFSKVVHQSGEYTLVGSNAYFNRKNLLNFTVTCVPDLYPGIQITQIKDSLRSSVHYFYGVISDDYGFSALNFHYSVDGAYPTIIPIPINKKLNTQEFYFTFDFAEFAGVEHTKVNYFFEVFDNDELSGPKSTRSNSEVYRVPDLNTIFNYNVELGNTVNTALQEAEKLAGDIVSEVKELQKKMLDNNVDNWEKQQLSKDIIEKKNKLDQLLQSVKENNLKKSDLNKSFTAQDSVLIEKQKQIQDLLSKVMDEEMKQLMKEFAKLSQDFSKERFQNLDEKMKLTFDQMKEELDRNIELLKRFQVEEKHDLVTKQLSQLQKLQDKFYENVRSFSQDSLFSSQEKIEKQFKAIMNNYENILKENETLTEPYSLNSFQEEWKMLSEKLKEQRQNISENKKDKNLPGQIKKKIEELTEQMQRQQKENFVNKSLPENDIELIIQNILIISLSQEELLKQFPSVASQSARYIELGRLQDLKRQEYKIIKDSLSVLAKSNLMLAALLSHKFYDLEIKFGLLPDYIQNNKRSELAREQQYIISYLNDIALSLTDALQKSKQVASGSDQQNSGKKEGSSSGKSSGGQKGEGYAGMKQFQNSLKKQLEELVSQMKKGEKGKPLQQGISKMIRESELFRKSLSDFISESGAFSNVEKQLLNEINRLLEENIQDLANYSISSQVINRNNLIYNKLIMSEKASKEREEFEEKRKSQSATVVPYQKPAILFDFQKKSGWMKTDFQKTDLKLNSYFKTMYNNYYIKLGNE